MAAKKIKIVSKRGTGCGSRWISRTNRMAIYNRDAFTCIWCKGVFSEDGDGLTLDHVVAVSKGGSDKATNLITVCHSCNSARGAKGNREWFAYMRSEYGWNTTGYSAKLGRQLAKDVCVETGRELAKARYGRA